LLEFGGEALGLVLVGGFGGALDQCDDIAHAEDAASDAAGVKRLQRVDFLAGADEHDRLPVILASTGRRRGHRRRCGLRQCR